MTQRDCPLCHRMHEVAEDGTIPTWRVVYEGDETIPAQDDGGFIHYEDAASAYESIKRDLQNAMKWHRNKHKLRIEEGTRASWSELFEEPGIYGWEA